MTPAPGKTCRKCGTHYEDVAAGFYLRQKPKKRPCYEQPCKACRIAYVRSPERSERRRELRAAQRAQRMASRPVPLTVEERRAKERERGRERERVRRLADPDGVRARMRRYLERNRERVNARNRANAKRNPWAGRAAKARRRAAVRECEMPVRPTDLRRFAVLQDGRCFWCDGALGPSPHVDHIIPLARGGTGDVWNVALACPTCNVRKQAQLPLEWAPRRWREVTTT